MIQLFRKLKLRNTFCISVRFKGHSKDHWSKREKLLGTTKALKHFDDFYKSVYGKQWNNIRTSLLQEKSKYVAIVNNFSDTERICSELENLGAIELKAIYEAQKSYLADEESLNESTEENGKSKSNVKEIERKMDSFISSEKLSELEEFYPAGASIEKKSLSDYDEDEEFDMKLDEPLKPVKLKSIESEDDIELDSNRIIYASSGLSISSLQEFMPATKLKGMDDWVLESDHYSYYTKGADFIVKVENENTLNIPKELKVYTFEKDNHSRFKAAKKGTTGVIDYYLMDGGSILPVLALDLQPGDRVLDMCAAPGGKSFVSIQTLLPEVVVMNDVKPSRVNRIREVIGSFVSNIANWDEKLLITTKDARIIDDKDVFNKILVDVPCTNDRHTLHVEEGNWFNNAYIRERLRLPELQSEILMNAFKLIAPGGTVVYATCSLSPVQNEGVVQLALKKAFEEANVLMVVKNISKGLKPLNCLYNFGKNELKYGHIVIPTMGNNWGPMYFCKMVRIR